MSSDASNDGKPAGLEFKAGAGSWRSKLVATILTIGIIAWMGSGFIFPAAEDETDTAERPDRIVAVAVRSSEAQTVEQVFVAEGQALPDRDTVIRVETSGQVAEVLLKKGQVVTANELIARVDPAERVAQLIRAEEDMRFAERELSQAETLLARGAQTGNVVAEKRADLKAAELQLISAKKAIQDTEITAPFAGRLDALSIDPGEFVSVGSEVARIVDMDPLTIAFQVPQQAIGTLREGLVAKVAFITGQERIGTVRYVGTNADAATRTFRAEVEVENGNGEIPAGLSARVAIPTGTEVAHFISPAILSLGTDGELGIKTVTADNIVEFHEIAIVRAQTDGIWISGLPARANIITVGQGFVRAGEAVDARSW